MSGGARTVTPVALQKRGPDDWAFIVRDDPATPFAAGEVVAVGGARYEVLLVEDTPTPGHLNLVVRRAP